MATTYKPRWAMALAVSLPRAILAATVGAVVGAVVGLSLGDPDAFARLLFVWLVLAVGALLGLTWQARTHWLTELHNGLSGVRDGCQVTVLWRDFERVERRRVGLITMEELVFREGHVRPLDPGAPFASRRVERLRRTGADRRIQPELYLPDWRNSPIGASCPAC